MKGNRITKLIGPFSASLLLVVAVVVAVVIAGVIDSTTAPVEAFGSKSLPIPRKMSSINTPPTRGTIASVATTALFVSQSNEGNGKGTTQEGGGEESEEDFQRRMAVVRSLQMSFYGQDASKEATTDACLAEHGNESSSSSSSSSSSKISDNDRDGEDSSRQNASNSGHGPPILEGTRGRISRLPIFRAAWYELPGRSNVLIIRDPIYTNMFERIFYTRTSQDEGGNEMTPWVFGHLYSPKEFETKQESTKPKQEQQSMSKKSTDRGNQLSAWNNCTVDTTKSSLSSSAVLGTLMYIRDFRRLKDGRILALVQGAERFTVEAVRQTLPYAVADVRVLPDAEELGFLGVERDDARGSEGDESSSSADPAAVYSCDETDRDEQLLVNCLRADEETRAGPARARAIVDSIHSYHHYECDPDQRLDGIPDKSNLGIVDITHDAISRALPYCRYSNLTDVLTGINNGSNANHDTVLSSSSSSSSSSLEFELLRRGITKIPPSDRRFSYITEPTYSSYASNNKNQQTVESPRSWTTEELEYELWLVLDHFSMATKKPVSPILLALLPTEDAMPKPWPSDFRLKIMREELHINSICGSSKYPNHKRQRRFSYSAAHLLEGVLPLREGIGGGEASPSGDDHTSQTGFFEVDEVQEFRALLLSVPSTRQRLRVVLETFHRWRLYQEWDEFA